MPRNHKDAGTVLPPGDVTHIGHYPRLRLRRNRSHDWVRRLVAENRLHASDLIWPVFVQEGGAARETLPSMPGVERLSIEALIDFRGARRPSGCAGDRDLPGGAAEARTVPKPSPDNLCNRAIRAVKQAVPELGVITDVALDPYTTHGQDGISRRRILNDETVDVLLTAGAG